MILFQNVEAVLGHLDWLVVVVVVGALVSYFIDGDKKKLEVETRNRWYMVV